MPRVTAAGAGLRGRLSATGVADRVILASRDAKWRLYQQALPPRLGERILDVGASSLTELPSENAFLSQYPYPQQVTAVTLAGADKLRSAFPHITVVEADGRDLPFDDDEFDVVHSNAVIEHVGPWPDQEQFARELRRVAKHGFVTTPNRWFPVEAHSRFPFIHWLPRPLAWKIQHALGCYSADAWLLDADDMRELFGGKLHRQRMAGLTATLVVTF